MDLQRQVKRLELLKLMGQSLEPSEELCLGPENHRKLASRSLSELATIRWDAELPLLWALRLSHAAPRSFPPTEKK